MKSDTNMLVLGSVYVLILVAVQNLRIPLGGVDGHAARHIGNMLRHPDGESFIQLPCGLL